MDITPTRAPEEARKRLLIVDDDAAVRVMLDRVLTGEGYDVQSAGDGEKALTLARDGAFDLVLLDLGLPPTDGWDIFARLRKVHPGLRAVIITARFGEAENAVLAGAEALFEKPLDYPTLLGKLAHLLSPIPGSLHPSHAKREHS